MKARRPLSVIPYYGGKAKMAGIIVERLDYSVPTFMTMFGGACRELLNKDPHTIEIYNEYNPCLCALIEMLSKPDTAQELIDRLYYETEPTESQFAQAKDLYDRCNLGLDDFIEMEADRLGQFLLAEGLATESEKGRGGKKLERLLLEMLRAVQLVGEEDCDVEFSARCSQLLEDITKRDTPDFKKAFIENAKLLDDLVRIQRTGGSIPRYQDIADETITDCDMAVAAYLVHTLSFSSIGGHFSKDKVSTDQAYRKRILTLYDCAERLKGVTVWNMDAMSFFVQKKYEEYAGGLCGSDAACKDSLFYSLLNNPDVMMFADPSYISPEDEAKFLKGIGDISGIDTGKGETVCGAIEACRADGKMPKNLGRVYARSFGYWEQEKFLQGIQNAKCKLMVCNYDLQLYDKYLTPGKGWVKETFETTTSVSARTSKSNKRLEVIWRNY